MSLTRFLTVFLSLGCLLASNVWAEVVIRDEGIEITREEFAAALALTPKQMRDPAANDLGDRFELINNMIQVRKLAQQAESLPTDTPGYWEMQFQILAIKRELAYSQEIGATEIPNPEALAREYYATQKDKYARKPETRSSSHILFSSPPGQPRDEVRAKAQSILEELRAGADFEEMVAEYSQDPGSKARDGAIKDWMRLGDPRYTPPYSEALFSIDAVGEYSEITDSQFGIHIIRLDGIRPSGYLPYDEVKSKIYTDIAAEFRGLAAKEINQKYKITDDAFIDGKAMEELFEPYKNAETP